MRKVILFLVLPFILNAQIQYSGSIHPYDLYRLSDRSEISLPFRIVELELGYAWENFDFKMNSALEYRWSGGKNEFDLREAYLVWYPRFGEVRLGKQIFVWGATDANNPTDNLSAYDYYYLFLPGTDQKIGSLSAAVNLYLGNWQIEAVVTPVHRENRLPFNEPDFPIMPIRKPSSDQIIDPENPLEVGIRTQTSIGGSDVSLSYFKGYDRIFSAIGTGFNDEGVRFLNFGFRTTEMLGADFVTFIGELTFRGEAAYFKTANDYKKSWALKLDNEAEYLQYVLQAEFTGPFDIQLMTQFIGNSILKVDGKTFDQDSVQIISLNENNFRAGMGTPFAMFINRSLLFSAIGNVMDDRLEIIMSGLVDLEDVGYMFGLGVDYSLIENWSIELRINKFIGGGASESDNIFNQLEDFSHMIIGLEYSF